MKSITIPKDVAEYLRTVAGTINAHVYRLDADLKLWGCDRADDDDDWSVQIHQGEVLTLTKNLRLAAEFADWLAQFEEGGAQ
ncbi:MAG: hypothetical protein LC676_18275 [Loktanella sp.]|nr:hypothetical protein [Loktanella sp.]